MVQNRSSAGDPFSKAVRVCEQVCAIAGPLDLIEETRAELVEAGVVDAVRDHDDAVLFDWLVEALAFQGIGDAVAQGYMDRHGTVTAAMVGFELKQAPTCPKLRSYWHFENCRYHKGSGTCAEPEHLDDCPLPRHKLRNGRLNQTAYSLFLFIRDVIGGDLVGWIDQRLAEAAKSPQRGTGAARVQAALIAPLGHVHGVSDKVLNMALSDLLLAADPERSRWVAAGAEMIANDSLVHAWLRRTGILGQLGHAHAYGPVCYRERGCAATIEALAARIDARRYNPSFPSYFPRFLQKAIWRFCAQTELNQCNGSNIDDDVCCILAECILFSKCGRTSLRA